MNQVIILFKHNSFDLFNETVLSEVQNFVETQNGSGNCLLTQERYIKKRFPNVRVKGTENVTKEI